MSVVGKIQQLMPPESDLPLESDVAVGKYANYFKVGHNAFEFILEFAQLYSEPSVEKVHTRIVTSPAYVRELLGVLQDSVDQYERTFGVIPRHE
jgi:hypothetical protein